MTGLHLLSGLAVQEEDFRERNGGFLLDLPVELYEGTPQLPGECPSQSGFARTAKSDERDALAPYRALLAELPGQPLQGLGDPIDPQYVEERRKKRCSEESSPASRTSIMRIRNPYDNLRVDPRVLLKKRDPRCQPFATVNSCEPNPMVVTAGLERVRGGLL